MSEAPKTCAACGVELENRRRKYCSEECKTQGPKMASEPSEPQAPSEATPEAPSAESAPGGAPHRSSHDPDVAPDGSESSEGGPELISDAPGTDPDPDTTKVVRLRRWGWSYKAISDELGGAMTPHKARLMYEAANA